MWQKSVSVAFPRHSYSTMFTPYRQHQTLTTPKSRFGEINPAELSPTDQKLWQILQDYKALLIPSFKPEERGMLLSILNEDDEDKQTEKTLALIENKTFPWENFSKVIALDFEEEPKTPGLQSCDDYEIYPTQAKGQKLLFSWQKGKQKGTSFCQFMLYHKKPSKQQKTSPSIQLYVGNNFASHDVEQTPIASEPEVFKVQHGNVWHTAENPELVKDAKAFMKFLELITELKWQKDAMDEESEHNLAPENTATSENTSTLETSLTYHKIPASVFFKPKFTIPVHLPDEKKRTGH